MSLAIAAVIGALLTDTLAGPVLGALPTSKFLVLWALFTLVMMAVAFATSALQTVLGAAGTLVVVIVFVIFGAPASGGTVPSPYLPGLWRIFGPYLPAGAGTTAVRNTIYFDGNGIATSLIVLAAYLVVGALAVILLRQRRPPSADRGRGRGVRRGGCGRMTADRNRSYRFPPEQTAPSRSTTAGRSSSS